MLIANTISWSIAICMLCKQSQFFKFHYESTNGSIGGVPIKVYGEQMPGDDDREAFTDSAGNTHMQPVMISYNKSYEPRPISPNASFQIAGRVVR